MTDDEILERAEQIKAERAANAETAERVGKIADVRDALAMPERTLLIQTKVIASRSARAYFSTDPVTVKVRGKDHAMTILSLLIADSMLKTDRRQASEESLRMEDYVAMREGKQ